MCDCLYSVPQTIPKQLDMKQQTTNSLKRYLFIKINHLAIDSSNFFLSSAEEENVGRRRKCAFRQVGEMKTPMSHVVWLISTGVFFPTCIHANNCRTSQLAINLTFLLFIFSIRRAFRACRPQFIKSQLRMPRQFRCILIVKHWIFTCKRLRERLLS